ncbi:MAG: hypothetical protein KGH81_06450 [Thaumarchaeota archaeon]|nr:hypothetical protein [Nitrososphaerota archaeon]MDE1841414.1 hypothetical protein [Nitrososphaerota archaeon]
MNLILKSLGIVIVLLAIKFAVDQTDLDLISINPVITALVAGVIFTIAIVFTGVLADYKESEKIPGELATSVKSLYKDSILATINEKDVSVSISSNIKELMNVITSNFRNNVWKLREISAVTDKIDEDIMHLAQKNTPPQYVVKLRMELGNIERTVNRVETIMETSFIPLAYLISEIAIGMVILVLMLVKMEPYFEGVALLGTVSFLLISLILLMKDMDNPFEYKKGTYADVDMSILFKTEEYLKNK